VRPYLEKPFTKTVLVEWLKVKALSSSPSTAKTKQNKTNKRCGHQKDLGLRSAKAPSQLIKVGHACHPICTGHINRIVV
jgi:hypothetical protein